MIESLLCRRSLLTQEGICLTLDPTFKFLEVAYPYIARRLLTDEDPALRERLFQVRSPSRPFHSLPRVPTNGLSINTAEKSDDLSALCHLWDTGGPVAAV